MIKNMHEKALDVCRYMRELGMPEEMINRVFLEMYVSKTFSDIPLENLGFRKATLDSVL